MEGRVAILLDGTPFVLIAPVTFSVSRNHQKIIMKGGFLVRFSAYYAS